MKAINAFERLTGGRWTGIRFHNDIPSGARMAEEPMHFCKVVSVSKTGPLTLTPKDVNCPGARRSFGWQNERSRWAIQAFPRGKKMEVKSTQSLNSPLVASSFE